MSEKNICFGQANFNEDCLKTDNETKVIRLEKIKNYIENLSDEQKTKFWIKTLFASYSTLPEIIKTVDRIIELQASSTAFVNDIYNVQKSAFDQMEKVINLGERKKNLVNIYIMVGELYKSLDNESVEIIEKKYLYNYSTEALARDLGLSSRTIYRRIDKIIDEVYLLCKKRNWRVAFIESQLKEEDWIKQRYLKVVTEYCKNTNYAETYNMSSSSL